MYGSKCILSIKIIINEYIPIDRLIDKQKPVIKKETTQLISYIKL